MGQGLKCSKYVGKDRGPFHLGAKERVVPKGAGAPGNERADVWVAFRPPEAGDGPVCSLPLGSKHVPLMVGHCLGPQIVFYETLVTTLNSLGCCMS